MSRPCLLFDDRAQDRLLAFGRPLSVIRADRPEEVAPALVAIGKAQASGNFVAGYFSYELGYAVEPRLAGMMPARRTVPLLWFGVFAGPEVVEGPAVDAALQGWSEGRAYAGPLQREWDADAYRRRFDRVKALIAAGDFYQANLTFRCGFPCVGDPLALFAGLRATSAARYGAYVDDGERHIVSLSPELFFEIAAGGAITARPMKGTAPRGADPVADILARQQLAESTKNRAENLMIVDLLRNDLGRIAEIGSVAVSGLFEVETYPTVHQMVSTISARLKPGTDPAGILRALFPCGSVTGAPKIRAMELIAELEQSPRGVYCGAIGHFAPDGTARFNVAIRTLTIAGGRGELGIGGAVVQDSEAVAEYEECLLKARYFENAHRPLGLIETLRWSPSEGFVRLDLHLARMRWSAAFFGIAFDATRAREALQAAVLSLPANGQARRARLVLSESGAFDGTAAPLPPGKDRWTFVVSPHRIMSSDVLLRHKTTWREIYDAEHARLSAEAGCDEIVFLNERDEVAEGSRTNVFVARDGRLMTPPLAAGALDGVLRRALLEDGRCIEATLHRDDLDGEVYLGNSLRGLIPARKI